MQPSEVHALRNILTMILGGIECDNLPLAKQAIKKMDEQLTAIAACAVCEDTPTGLMDRLVNRWRN